jgi:DNA-binding NtrC family response regulator
MFQQATVLIVEDEPLLAMEIQDAVEAQSGIVVGPFSSVAEAMRCIQQEQVTAAILDVQLDDRDISPVVIHLVECGTPLVVYSGTGLPADLDNQFPEIPVLKKPTSMQDLIETLWSEIQRFGRL